MEAGREAGHHTYCKANVGMSFGSRLIRQNDKHPNV
jgi:hypothetical protein